MHGFAVICVQLHVKQIINGLWEYHNLVNIVRSIILGSKKICLVIEKRKSIKQLLYILQIVFSLTLYEFVHIDIIVHMNWWCVNPKKNENSTQIRHVAFALAIQHSILLLYTSILSLKGSLHDTITQYTFIYFLSNLNCQI